MSRSYSQRKAFWAITKASFKAIFAHPTSLIFSLLFPIIFILIFGSFGSGGVSTQSVAILPGDTSNALFDSIRSAKLIRIVTYKDTAEMNDAIEKGKLTAALQIVPIPNDSTYAVRIYSSSASGAGLYLLKQQLDHMALKIDYQMTGAKESHFKLVPIVRDVKTYRQIDFVLPGQIGFSILFSTLFGIAFTFFNMREQLVLKRFYASPVNKLSILVGIGLSRLFFQVINVVVLLLVGYFFMNFTLVHGALTFAEMLLLSIYMLFLLMGVGLIFSSVVKTDTSIPLLINLFGFPQMLLSGTFFTTQVFPKWLQNLCEILPLTHFNNAMRKISFEGLHLYDCWKELGILAIWMLIIYVIAAKVMKWE